MSIDLSKLSQFAQGGELERKQTKPKATKAKPKAKRSGKKGGTNREEKSTPADALPASNSAPLDGSGGDQSGGGALQSQAQLDGAAEVLHLRRFGEDAAPRHRVTKIRDATANSNEEVQDTESDGAIHQHMKDNTKQNTLAIEQVENEDITRPCTGAFHQDLMNVTPQDPGESPSLLSPEGVLTNLSIPPDTNDKKISSSKDGKRNTLNKSSRKRSERQERMANLMAHQDLSSLRLCDIVTRVKYSELKKARTDAAEKKNDTYQNHEKTVQSVLPPRRQFQEVQEPQVLAPQVTVVDGKIVLNERSLEVSGRSTQPRPQYSRVEEVEDRIVHSGTYANWRKPRRWKKEETSIFCEGLKQFGTDFTLLATILPDRTRQELAAKFKAERKKNPQKIAELMAPRRSGESTFKEGSAIYKVLCEKLKAKRNQIDNAAPETSLKNYPAGNVDPAEQLDPSAPGLNPSQSHEGLSEQQGYDQPVSFAAEDVHSWDDDQEYYY